MTPADWTPIVEAASRAHVESMRQGTWDELDTLTRYNVGQALLPAVKAAVEVALKQHQCTWREIKRGEECPYCDDLKDHPAGPCSNWYGEGGW